LNSGTAEAERDPSESPRAKNIGRNLLFGRRSFCKRREARRELRGRCRDEAMIPPFPGLEGFRFGRGDVRARRQTGVNYISKIRSTIGKQTVA
jgi:hypothetical protein